MSSFAAFMMASMDWAVLGAWEVAWRWLLLWACVFIFYIQPDASDLASHRSSSTNCSERRDTIYDNLRDLRFEYRSGK